MTKQKYCLHPFENLEISSLDGNKINLYVCCPAWTNINTSCDIHDDIGNAWNSPAIQDLRKSIIDGSYRHCDSSKCSYIQGKHLVSLEEISNKDTYNAISQGKTFIETSPKIINLSSDFTCNFSCPSCRTSIIKADDANLLKLKKFHNNFFDKYLSQVERLIICSSGDPFASKLYRDILFELDGSKYPKLKIQIVTNAHLFNKATWEKMHKIHSNIYQVCVSLDASRKDTYEKLRRGGNFENTMKNLDFISDLRAKGLISRTEIDFVVQKDNYKEMAGIVEMGTNLGIDFIRFQKLLNDWSAFDQDTYRELAICEKSHPDHYKLLDHLKNPVFLNKRVILGNIAPLSTSSA